MKFWSCLKMQNCWHIQACTRQRCIQSKITSFAFRDILSITVTSCSISSIVFLQEATLRFFFFCLSFFPYVGYPFIYDLCPNKIAIYLINLICINSFTLVFILVVSFIYINSNMQQDFAETSKATMEKNEADRKFWQKICKNFLKGQPSLLI